MQSSSPCNYLGRRGNDVYGNGTFGHGRCTKVNEELFQCNDCGLIISATERPYGGDFTEFETNLLRVNALGAKLTGVEKENGALHASIRELNAEVRRLKSVDQQNASYKSDQGVVLGILRSCVLKHSKNSTGSNNLKNVALEVKERVLGEVHNNIAIGNLRTQVSYLEEQLAAKDTENRTLEQQLNLAKEKEAKTASRQSKQACPALAQTKKKGKKKKKDTHDADQALLDQLIQATQTKMKTILTQKIQDNQKMATLLQKKNKDIDSMIALLKEKDQTLVEKHKRYTDMKSKNESSTEQLKEMVKFAVKQHMFNVLLRNHPWDGATFDDEVVERVLRAYFSKKIDLGRVPYELSDVYSQFCASTLDKRETIDFQILLGLSKLYMKKRMVRWRQAVGRIQHAFRERKKKE